MRAAVLISLLWVVPVWAAPPSIVIPAEVVPSGQYVVMTPDTDAVSVLFVGLSGIEPIPSAVLNDPRMFVMDTYGKPAGRYRFAAVAASATGEQARADFVLVIGDAPDPPPPPPPDPGDEFTRALKAAYIAESDAGKAAHVDALAGVYRKGAGLTASARTAGELFTQMAVEARLAGVFGTVPGVQKVIQAELQKHMPADPAAGYDPAKAAAVFTRIADALEAL